MSLRGSARYSTADNRRLSTHLKAPFFLTSRIEMRLISTIAQKFEDRLHRVRVRVDKGDKFTEQVMHVRINLLGGPTREIEQRESLAQLLNQTGNRVAIQCERRGQTGIPAATGTVDEMRFGQLVE